MKFKFINIKIKDVLIIVFILSATFGYYIDRIFFKVNLEETPFYDILVLVYYSKMKVLIIIFCLIWFFTSKHWWKSSILIILSIELLKLISVFNPNQKYIDEIEFYTSLPITIPVILLLLYLSYKVNEFNLAKKVRNRIDKNIDEVFFELYQDKNKELNDLNKEYNKFKTNSSKSNKIDYIKELILIRDKFYENKE
ncbi:hypothetical protein [uncultured Psychroserpens sp.]|uniref:hypothetical protein n=1 Tax=uncultured Psychroserpens sp. TaxID=255436 RepID=UPI00261466FE|nr:hypothetical protein [uncultured Psychroserpens sp.]